MTCLEWRGYWARPLAENVLAHQDHWPDVLKAAVLSVVIASVLWTVWKWPRGTL